MFRSIGELTYRWRVAILCEARARKVVLLSSFHLRFYQNDRALSKYDRSKMRYSASFFVLIIMKAKKSIEHYKRAAEILRYDPETGRLIRRVTTGSRSQKGEEAGTVNQMGYSQINITVGEKSKTLVAHRVIYYIYYGSLPAIIDHADGDKLNNRIDNLRPATNQQNQRNMRSQKGSSSKYLGVSFSKTQKKWAAYICPSGKGKNKNLGYFADEVEAAKAYDAAAREHFGEFANPNFPIVDESIK